MPELPEVETVRRGLIPVLEGRRLIRVVARRPDLRLPLPENLGQCLVGRRVMRLDRRGKYLLWHVDGNVVLIVHLGMSGRMRIFEGPPPPEELHDHVIFSTEDEVTIRFCDPRRFGLILLSETSVLASHRLLASMGPEPLDEAFNGPFLARQLAGRKSPIKTALMDQRLVAGLGNIYVCEALFRSAISPLRRSGSIGAVRAERLVAAIKTVLLDAIAAGGSTLRDHRRPDGELGYFQHRFDVYDREGKPCSECPDGTCPGVRRIVQGGRSTFYCSKWQR
jgi:formamidopyrimidine-DNA glycosylase